MDERVDKPECVHIGVQVGKRVVAVRVHHVDEVEDHHFITHLFQQAADRAVGFALWVADDVGTVRLHEIWLYKKSRFAGTGAADDQNIGVHLMLWRQFSYIHTDADVLGDQQIAVFTPGFEMRAHLAGVAPVRRAMFLTRTAVAFFGVVPCNGEPIERERRQYEFFRIGCDMNDKGRLQRRRKGREPLRQPNALVAAPAAQQRKPENGECTQQPEQGEVRFIALCPFRAEAASAVPAAYIAVSVR